MSDTPFRDALLAVLERRPADVAAVRLRNIAETLVAQAEAGEPWAIRALMQRLDLSPAAAAAAGEDAPPRRVIFSWKDAEPDPPQPGEFETTRRNTNSPPKTGQGAMA